MVPQIKKEFKFGLKRDQDDERDKVLCFSYEKNNNAFYIFIT